MCWLGTRERHDFGAQALLVFASVKCWCYFVRKVCQSLAWNRVRGGGLRVEEGAFNMHVHRVGSIALIVIIYSIETIQVRIEKIAQMLKCAQETSRREGAMPMRDFFRRKAATSRHGHDYSVLLPIYTLHTATPSRASMTPQDPSIQSFFAPQSSSSLPPRSTQPGDGFTTDEINRVLEPVVLDSWMPQGTYEDYEIAALEPVRKCVTITGRIVSVLDVNKVDLDNAIKAGRALKSAKGAIDIIIIDDSGALRVRCLVRAETSCF